MNVETLTTALGPVLALVTSAIGTYLLGRAMGTRAKRREFVDEARAVERVKIERRRAHAAQSRDDDRTLAAAGR
jgi:hypothetical protein